MSRGVCAYAGLKLSYVEMPNSPPVPKPGSLKDLVTRYPIVAVSLPVLAGLALQAVLSPHSEWLDVYVRAARTLLAGCDLYGPGTNYLYPPFQALLAVPFVSLPSFVARLAWYLINVASLVGLLRSAWWLAGGPKLGAVATTGSRDWLALGLGLACSAPYMLNALAHQQTDVLIAYLVMAGCVRLARLDNVAGAILLGLAAACKGPPLLFAAYLIFRRKWGTTTLIVVVAIGVNLLPDLVCRAPGGGLWLQLWLKRFVLQTQRLDASLGVWGSALLYNQSLGGSLQRVVNTPPRWTSAGLLTVAKRVVIDPVRFKAIVYPSMLAMVAISIGAALRGQRVALRDSAKEGLPGRTAIEFSIVIILMVLMSPMSSLAHFSVLVLSRLLLDPDGDSGGQSHLVRHYLNSNRRSVGCEQRPGRRYRLHAYIVERSTDRQRSYSLARYAPRRPAGFALLMGATAFQDGAHIPDSSNGYPGRQLRHPQVSRGAAVARRFLLVGRSGLEPETR
jgi:Glycosyltransferase family 87